MGKAFIDCSFTPRMLLSASPRYHLIPPPFSLPPAPPRRLKSLIHLPGRRHLCGDGGRALLTSDGRLTVERAGPSAQAPPLIPPAAPPPSSSWARRASERRRRRRGGGRSRGRESRWRPAGCLRGRGRRGARGGWRGRGGEGAAEGGARPAGAPSLARSARPGALGEGLAGLYGSSFEAAYFIYRSLFE